jgi:hypothetical protein
MTGRERKKPTGELGVTRIRFSGEVTFTPVVFPTTKREIEQFILDAALKAGRLRIEFGPKKIAYEPRAIDLRSLYGLSGAPVQNEENHFDFTLPTDAGPTYLDLMEIAR